MDEAGSCNFLTDSCKFPTEGLRVLKIWNSAPKFAKNAGFSAPNIAFLETNIENEPIFFAIGRNSRGATGPCPPPRHEATELACRVLRWWRHGGESRGVGRRRAVAGRSPRRARTCQRCPPACSRESTHAASPHRNCLSSDARRTHARTHARTQNDNDN